jgi:cation:H+ antiporter
MENMYIQILGFCFCAAIIIFSGTKLSYYGDQIAELTGMGKAWVGLILMASVTSLPELITGISSVAIVKAPDLAAGDIFGSCVFNLLILSFLDSRLKQPLFSMVKPSHMVAAIGGIILLATAGLAIFVAAEIPNLLWISWGTLFIFGIYFFIVWLIFKYEQTNALPVTAEDNLHSVQTELTLKKAIGAYTLHALIVIGAAIFLPYFGENLAHHSGLGTSFFGTLFLAAATSLPELVVSVSALKMGALDMAVGNLLGSNIFNIFILGLDDVFYTDGSLFSAISPSHVVSVFFIIIMTAVVCLGLLFKPKKKHVWMLSIDSFVLVLLYALLMSYLFVKTAA